MAEFGGKSSQDKLSLKDLNNVMRHEASGVATRWYDLGVELLDSNTAVLDVIKTSHQRDDDRCSDMFKTWLEMKPDASWSQLVAALTNIGMRTAADNIQHRKMTGSISKAGSDAKSGSSAKAIYTTPEQASVEFGMLLLEILEELQKNESKNLKRLKVMASTLTVKDMSGVRMFSDSELEAIHVCNDIETLLTIKLRHCYRWDDHSMLTVLMSSLNAENCVRLLHTFKMKVDIKMKLQQIHEHCLNESQQFPEEYHKMVAIVDNKIFSAITKKEYDELRQFIAEHCGVEPYVMSPFSQASSFNSIVIEWFIPTAAISYMVQIAEANIDSFSENTFVYLKISSTVIFDHRSSQFEYDQLLSAVQKGDTTAMERLVNIRYLDVNALFRHFKWKKTALHFAAKGGHDQVVETLIKLGAEVNAIDEHKRTPLHLAVESGQVRVIQILIKLEANVNSGEETEWTPLHIATQNGHSEVVEILIKSEANVNATDKDGWTPLHVAVDNGYAGIVNLLIKSEANVNATKEDGWAPLHVAAENDHLQIVEMLIKSEANVNAAEIDGWTPLHVAAASGHARVVELLIKSKASINAINKNEDTPLYTAAQNGHASVTEMLIKSEANVHGSFKNGWTALHVAAENGHVQVIEILIKSGVDVDVSSKDEWTPLHAATQNGHEQVVEMLISLGAIVNTTNNGGDVPLHIASRKGNWKVAKLLVEAGADIYVTNKFNRMPLQEALRCNQSHIVHYFVKEVKMDTSITHIDKATQLQIKRTLKEIRIMSKRSLGQLAAGFVDTDSDQSSDTHSSASSGHESSDTDE